MSGRARRPARRAALSGVAPRPWQRRAVGLRRVGRGEHERRGFLEVALRAQALDGAGQRELRPAEAFDEVAAAADAEGLELREGVVEDREAARDPFGEDLLAGDDAVALQQQLGLSSPALAGLRLAAKDRVGERPATLNGGLTAPATRAEAAGRAVARRLLRACERQARRA